MEVNGTFMLLFVSNYCFKSQCKLYYKLYLAMWYYRLFCGYNVSFFVKLVTMFIVNILNLILVMEEILLLMSSSKAIQDVITSEKRD
jgi:Serpentine type 7TM GPCR chemoreceptor Srx.